MLLGTMLVLGTGSAQAQAGQPIDPYAGTVVSPPPGAVLPVAPPPRVPPVLPVAPPPSVPPVLPVAPPVAAPIDPYAAPAPYGSPQPVYVYPPQPPPPLAPPPAWDQGGCPAGCNEAPPPSVQLNYTPRSPSAQTEKRPRYGLMAAGLSILGGLWVLSGSTGSLVDHYELFIPVAGPFITAHDLDRHWDAGFGRTMVVGLLAMDGLFQTAGLIMAIAGGASRAPVKKRPPTAPSFYPTMGGLSGRF